MKKIQRFMTPTETDQPVVRHIKTAVTDNLSTRYVSEEITNFPEECTVLDPRFKDRHIEADRLCTIYHRLPFICSAGGPIKVKIEQGDAAPDPPAAPHQETPEPPQLHQLPHLPMDVTEGEPQIPTNEETPPTEIDLVQEQPSSSTVPAKRGGLAAILDDVVLVKGVKGNNTPLEKATDEINKYKEVPQIKVVDNPLKWWQENAIYFPYLSQLVKERLCIPATSVPSERIFSTAGDIVTAQRAALNSDMVDKLIFLKKNSDF